MSAEMHPAPSDPGYVAHVEALAYNIGLSKEEVEAELAHLRRMKELAEYSTPTSDEAQAK